MGQFNNFILLFFYVHFSFHYPHFLRSCLYNWPSSQIQFLSRKWQQWLIFKDSDEIWPTFKNTCFFFLPFAYVNLLHGPKLKTLLFCTCDSHSFFFLLVLIYFFFLIEFFFFCVSISFFSKFLIFLLFLLSPVFLLPPFYCFLRFFLCFFSFCFFFKSVTFFSTVIFSIFLLFFFWNQR